MRQATAIMLFVMLAVTQVASFDALPSLWSEYYRNALYRNSAARLQQASQQCLVEDAPATIACQSARLTTGGRNTFVHVCPDRGKNFIKLIIITPIYRHRNNTDPT